MTFTSRANAYRIFEALAKAYAPTGDNRVLALDDLKGLTEENWGGWEDLRFPATAFNPPGTASDPGLDTTDGTFLFDATAVELIYCVVQLPHSFMQGSSLHPHIHWAKTTSAAGDVAWRVRYKTSKVGEITTDFSAADYALASTQDDNTEGRHLISGFTALDTAALDLDISDILIFEIAREGDAVTDTYAADAKFFEFDIHYRIDSLGSEQEYVK